MFNSVRFGLGLIVMLSIVMGVSCKRNKPKYEPYRFDVDDPVEVPIPREKHDKIIQADASPISPALPMQREDKNNALTTLLDGLKHSAMCLAWETMESQEIAQQTRQAYLSKTQIFVKSLKEADRLEEKECK